MKLSRPAKITLITVAIIAVICFGILRFFFCFCAADFAPSELPGDIAMNDTEELMATIRDKPDNDPPYNGPHGNLYHPDCWEMLSDRMAANDNQYTLTLDYATDTRTPFPPEFPHDFVEAMVYVDFPDGTRVEVYYYQNHVDGCVKSPDTYG